MARIGVFTPERAKEIDEAVSKLGTTAGSRVDVSRTPWQPQPVFRIKITGAADADGVYPGILMAFNGETLVWTELGEGYAYKVDTI